MKCRLYLATRNQHKVKEIRNIFGKDSVEIVQCPAGMVFPEETGGSFEENAYLKARFLYMKFSFEYVIGEDSGLVVESLNGLPGIYSARFAGEGKDDRENIKKLLEMLSPYEAIEKRKAKFVTVACLLAPGQKKFFTGEVEGFITFSPRGRSGFGYDPVFEIPRLKKTFAEIPSEEKNRISHRNAAFCLLREYLREKGLM